MESKYVKIAKVSEFEGLRFRKYSWLARNVAIFRDADGVFFATEISRKHQNWDLTTGRFDGDIVTCPRHGWKRSGSGAGMLRNRWLSPISGVACPIAL